MPKQLQLRRGTTAQHATFTGAVGEVTIDTDKKVVVVHDGSTVGGFSSQKELISGTNIKTVNSTSLLGSGNIDVVAKITSTDNAIARYDGTGGAIQNSSVYIDDSGNVLVTSSTGRLGYGTGAGGTVTQLTSRSTAVTLNKPSGQITMNNAALAAGASVGFILNNNLILGNQDLLSITTSGASNYDISYSCGTGIAFILIKNKTDVSLSDSVVINFAVIKGATA